ncbi:hypothetical protein [Candidatus Laterigemmans baculatus]|nr:hypothetical protein [Candidatus Laterigemmans baculatus]
MNGDEFARATHIRNVAFVPRTLHICDAFAELMATKPHKPGSVIDIPEVVMRQAQRFRYD